MIKYLILCILPFQLIAQDNVLYRINNLSVLENGKYKLNAFSGGLNNVAFSSYDFNKDGLLDLYLYDNQSNKSQTYIHQIVGGEHQYIIDYNYEKNFPNDLGYWAMMRDYNCDNIQDLFSYEGTTIKLYKGKNTSKGLGFDLVNSFYTAEDTGTSTNKVQIYTCGIPIIEDVNFDGYLDIISVQSGLGGSTTFTYMKNEKVSKGLPCDSFKLKVKSNCWGKSKVVLPLDININQCGGTTTDGLSFPYNKGSLRHCGSISAWLFDNDNDGDYEVCVGEEFTEYTVYGRNGGQKDFSKIDTNIKNFPDYNTPIPYKLPQGYWMDIDNDGKKDLVVTTLVNSGQYDNYLERDHISYYRNEPVGNISNFKLQQNDFIVGNSIDAGQGSFPVLFDYNGDSLIDLLISNEKYYLNDTSNSSGIFLYKNVGTKKAPKYEFVTNDFASLRKYKLKRIVPAFGDLDGDGDMDMVFGDSKTGLHIAINHPIGKMANFDSVKINYITLGLFNVNASPFLYDINQDGKIDLLMGENNGMVYLMKNKGTISNAIFDTIGMNRRLGKMSAQDSILDYYFDLKTTISMDAKFIYLGNRLGNVFMYEWNKDSIDKGIFKRRSISYFPYNSGNYASIAIGDINDDGINEYFVGNIRGGLQLYTTKIFENVLEKDIDTLMFKDGYLSVNDIDSKSNIVLFPNPSNSKITIEGISKNSAYEFIIYNTIMQVVSSGKIDNETSIQISDLENGNYFLKLKSDHEIITKQFIKISE